MNDQPDPKDNLPEIIPENETHTILPDKSTKVGEIYFEAHQGPLPAPETLKKYDLIQPGFADRIFKMAEDNSKHRKQIEIEQCKCESRGQWMAFSICIFAMICAFVSVLKGFSVAGSILGGASLAIIISSFLGKKILGSKSEK